MKRFIAIVIMTVLVMSLATGAFASGEAATIPTFDVTLNGVSYDSSMSEYPLLVYRDITYVPMTYYMARLLGLSADWTKESGLSVSCVSTGGAFAYSDYPRARKNAQSCSVTIATGAIKVNGKTIDNDAEPYPLLMFRDITYFPLTWRFCHDEFGWSYDFSSEKGLRIATDGLISDGASWFSVKTIGDNEQTMKVMRRKLGTLDVEPVFEVENTIGILMGGFREYDDGLWFRYTTGVSAITATTRRVKLGEKIGEPVIVSTSPYPMGGASAPENAVLYDGRYFFITEDNEAVVSFNGETGIAVLYFDEESTERSLAVEEGRLYAEYTLGGERWRVRLYADDIGIAERT